MSRFQPGKILVWLLITAAVWFISNLLLPEPPMAIALAALGAAIAGTILFGEERLPFVAGAIVLLLVTQVTTFDHFIEGAEWVLFVKLVALLTWVEFLYSSGYFETMIERLLPKGLKGTALLATISALAFISAALIDEVNSIVIIYFLTRAIIGFANGRFLMSDEGWGKTTVSLVSSTNIGSQLLPLGNPVGIAIAGIAGFSALDFIQYAWLPAILTLTVYLLLQRQFYPALVKDFGKVEVSQEDFESFDQMGTPSQGEYQVIEVETDSSTHTISREKPPFAILNGLFIFGVIGLVLSQPLGTALGFDGTTGLGLFAVLLWGITLHIASSYGQHNEGLLKQLPWSTLLFIVFLFAIAHVLDATGITELVATSLFGVMGSNILLWAFVIALIGGLVTAVMDNVIAIAVISGIIVQLEGLGLPVTVLWFSLLAAGVVAANSTPIGSAANIIANARARLSWAQWWNYGGWLAIPVTLVNIILLYIWIVVILGR
ncbi:MAG TPA: SLC13 family permease [Aggregatilineales bacterium]|nr:SLC13 family permease [Aggregatilineales bacterium]